MFTRRSFIAGTVAALAGVDAAVVPMRRRPPAPTRTVGTDHARGKNYSGYIVVDERGNVTWREDIDVRALAETIAKQMDRRALDALIRAARSCTDAT